MPNWFFTDADGIKQGPINDQQLQSLVKQGIIVPTTVMETDGGHTGQAGQIPNLFPAASPFAQCGTSVPPANSFCTHCGKGIAQHAVACISCGASPIGHRNFCRHCGAALNPAQVVCIKCGSSVASTPASRQGYAGQSGMVVGQSGNSNPKSRVVAAILALLLGGIGAQKYYMGSWGWGLVFTLASLLLFFPYLITEIIGIVEGIQYLIMSDEDFAAKYPSETQAPFRW
ncbi:MAG: double zinc ribbon domain-containing protein [Thermoguttaceae bacterium]